MELKRTGNQTPVTRVGLNRLPSFIDRIEIQYFLKNVFPIKLYPAQMDVLRDWLTYDPETGDLWYVKMGLTIPRQNGKTLLILCFSIIMMIFFDRNILYTTYNAATYKKLLKMELIPLIDSSPKLREWFPERVGTKVIQKNADNREELICIDPVTHRKKGIMFFATRASKNARGGTLGLVIFDEAQHLTAEENAAFEPVASKVGTQAIFSGTAALLEESDVFTSPKAGSKTEFLELRKKWLKTKDEQVNWNEWGSGAFNRIDDIDIWYKMNPGLGYCLAEAAFRTSSLSEEEFNTERLGYWPSQMSDRAIDISRWKNLVIEKPVINSETKVALAVKFSAISSNQICLVAIAMKTKDMPTYVEVIEEINTEGVWINQLYEIIEEYRKSRSCVSIMVDGREHIGTLKDFLRQKGRWDSINNRREYGKILIAQADDISSSGPIFVNQINEENLSHTEQPLVDASIMDVRQREIRGQKGGYGFESMSKKTDPAYVEAMALAVLSLRKKIRMNVADIDNRAEGILGAAKGSTLASAGNRGKTLGSLR